MLRESGDEAGAMESSEAMKSHSKVTRYGIHLLPEIFMGNSKLFSSKIC